MLLISIDVYLLSAPVTVLYTEDCLIIGDVGDRTGLFAMAGLINVNEFVFFKIDFGRKRDPNIIKINKMTKFIVAQFFFINKINLPGLSSPAFSALKVDTPLFIPCVLGTCNVRISGAGETLK